LLIGVLKRLIFKLQKLDRGMTIEDEMGKSMIAINVFAMAIEYLVGDMMKSVNDKLTSAIEKDEVHWVLTVPAIWTDAAKQFMREAAVQVIFVFSIFCISLIYFYVILPSLFQLNKQS
jgi:molecular chaperone DnaK (HSP70)